MHRRFFRQESPAHRPMMKMSKAMFGCDIAFNAFGTVVMAKAYGGDGGREALRVLRSACRRYERLFSAFDPFSDVGRINRACSRWVPVASETYGLLQASLEYCRASRNCFDVTAKPLVDLWDVHKGVIPAEDDIRRACAHVDYRFLQLEQDGNCCLARLADPQAALDLGGIAKGWIADQLCRQLEGYNLDGFIISLGGNVAARGFKPDGSPFIVGLRDPCNHSRVVESAALVDASAVASGVTERFFEKDGRIYSHILDPIAGRPVCTDVQSVTLIGRRSIDCDGYSTTLCALGMDRGPAYAQTLKCIDKAVFISGSGDVVEVSAGEITRY